MKKIFILSTVIICVALGFCNEVEAYYTSEYEIDIPSTYTNESENSFTNEDGSNINIGVEKYNYSIIGNPYTEKELNKFVDAFYSDIDEYRAKMKVMLKEETSQYGLELSEEQLDEYVKTIKRNSIEEKEICFFTKNNYQGFHVIVSYKIGEDDLYVEQYMFFSRNKAYTITISSSSFENLKSAENENIVNSFTINNFRDENGSNKYIMQIMIIPLLGTIIIIAITVICSYAYRNNKIKNEKKNENIIICPKCGKEINQECRYCIHCGFKLK